MVFLLPIPDSRFLIPDSRLPTPMRDHLPDARICIVQPNPATASETFLEAHAAYLPARVTVLPGDVGGSWAARAARKARRLLTGRPLERDRTEAYVRAFRAARPVAVLAEYGPTGVQVLEACRRRSACPWSCTSTASTPACGPSSRRTASPIRTSFAAPRPSSPPRA